MVFNKKKFNIFMCFTMALICVAVVFSTIDYSSFSNSNPGHLDADSEEGDQNPDFPADEGGNIEASGMKKLTKPFSNGWMALNYALSLLDNYDYYLDINQEIVAQAAGVAGTQKIRRESYKFGGKSYIKVIADGSGIPMGLGENYTEFMIIDTSNIITRKQGGQLQTQAIASYKAKCGVMPNEIPYVLNKNSTTLSFSNEPNLNYYVLTLNLNSNAWADYKKSLEANGGAGSNPSISSISLTIKIDKTYGYIKSISAKEKYEISRGGFTADSISTVTMSFTYCKDYSQKISEIQSQF